MNLERTERPFAIAVARSVGSHEQGLEAVELLRTEVCSPHTHPQNLDRPTL